MRNYFIDHERFPALALNSPHLLIYLQRYFTDAEILRIEDVFAEAVLRGGREELDFVRPEAEVSFNPRPARSALILMKEGGVKQSSVVRVVVAGSMWRGERLEAREHTNIYRLVGIERDLFELAFVYPEQLNKCENREMGAQAAMAGLSVLLDRMRHYHRSPQWISLLKAYTIERQDSELAGLSTVDFNQACSADSIKVLRKNEVSRDLMAMARLMEYYSPWSGETEGFGGIANRAFSRLSSRLSQLKEL